MPVAGNGPRDSSPPSPPRPRHFVVQKTSDARTQQRRMLRVERIVRTARVGIDAASDCLRAAREFFRLACVARSTTTSVRCQTPRLLIFPATPKKFPLTRSSVLAKRCRVCAAVRLRVHASVSLRDRAARRAPNSQARTPAPRFAGDVAASRATPVTSSAPARSRR